MGLNNTSHIISFAQHLNSKKYKHSVESIGPISLKVVLENLVDGGQGFQGQQPLDIIQNALGGACLTNHFNDAELVKIIQGNPANWDTILLFKVIQRVSVLSPFNSSLWTHRNDESATLESLIYQMKELEVEVRHKFDERILSDVEVEVKLGELRALSVKIFDGVVGVAVDGDRMVDMDGIEYAKMLVNDVIEDVNQ